MNLETLDIQITGSANQAESAIDGLVAKLGVLESATSSLNVTKAITALDAITTATSKAGSGVAGITNLTNSLANLNKVKISPTITSGLAGIVSGVNAVTNVGGAIAIGALATGLQGLNNVKIPNNIGTQMQGLAQGVSTLSTTSVAQLNAFANNVEKVAQALAPLGNIAKSSFNSIVNGMIKLQKAGDSLHAFVNGSTFDAFIADVERLNQALIPLANNLDKVGRGFSALGGNVKVGSGAMNSMAGSAKSMTASTSSAVAGTKKMGGGFMATATKAVALVGTLKVVGRAISGAVTKSNEYVENMNLFTVSMGEFAGEATEYGLKVQSVMGIDLSEWARNQGIFQTLLTGFGVAGEGASKMSKNVTQLGYDMSSFFNIPFEDALTKLQSGLSGELEPLRRLGFDLSKTRLQQEAYALGIDKTVASMTQAEKAELRYHAIMTQVQTVQGDMARTLQNPQNQLRILQSQFSITARNIGNMFIPALTAILPIVNAVTQVIGRLASMLASLFGYKAPEIEMPDMSGGIAETDDMAESIDDVGGSAKQATKALKKMKDVSLGFDELNVIAPPEPDADSGGGGGGGGAGVPSGGGLGIPIYEYDFLAGANKQLDEMVNSMMRKLEIVGGMFKPTGQRIGEMFAVIKQQASAFDWSKTFDNVGWGLIDAVARGAHLIVTVVAPIIEGLNLPAIGNAGLEMFATALNTISVAFKAIQPGIASFMDKGVKPIAKWVGEKLVDAFNFFGGIFKDWGKWFLKNKSILEDFFGALGTLLGGIWKVAKPILEFLWSMIKVIVSAVSSGMQIIFTAVMAVATPLINIIGKIIGVAGDIMGLIFKPIIDGLGQFIDIAKLGASTLVDSFTMIYNKVKSVFTSIKDFALGAWDAIKNAWSTVTTFFPDLFSNAWTGIQNAWSAVTGWFGNIWSGIKNTFSVVGTWFKDIFSNAWTAIKNVFSPVGSFFGGIWDTIKQKFTNIGQKVSDAISGTFKGAINAILRGAEWVLNAPIRAINKAIELINRIPLNPFTISYISELNLPKFAGGGYVGAGQMFIAREAGAEMVGNIGGRTAVANNDQITTAITNAIAPAIYDAVMSAMRASGGGGGSQDINLYLDGKQLTHSVETRQRETGANIYGGGILNGI